jgi:hypothetical protein
VKISEQNIEDHRGADKKDELGDLIDAYEDDKDRIFCPECGKRYSSSQYKCPSCGKINPKESFPIGSYYWNILITSEILFIIFTLLGVKQALLFVIIAPIAMLPNVLLIYLFYIIGGSVKRAFNKKE